MMSIHQANIEDVEEILFVINKSNSEAYKKIIPPEYFREPVLTLDELLKEFEEMTFYTYRVKDYIIGVAALKVKRNEVGRILWVYVLPEHQRKGVGTSLVNHVENKAVRMKLKKLRVLTNENAYWARKFYKKAGYKMVGEIPRPWGNDIVYEKTLLDP